VTASFGVRGFQGKEPPEFSLMVREADKALYAAKRAGRNQIKIEPLEFWFLNCKYFSPFW